MAEECLSFCLSINDKSDSLFEQKLKRYNDLCEKIESFDLEKDVDKAINYNIDSLKQEFEPNLLEMIIKVYNEELKILKIDNVISSKKNNVNENVVDSTYKLTDEDVLEKYREDLKHRCEGLVDDKIMIEKYEHGRVNLSPLHIYVHNKMGEIYKYFKSKNVDFSTSIIAKVIYAYFASEIIDAKYELTNYYNKNNSYIAAFRHVFKNETLGIEYLKNYNKICDEILNFSIEKDLDKVFSTLRILYEDNSESYSTIMGNLDSYNNELKKLGIDYVVESKDLDIVPIEKKKSILLNLREKVLSFADCYKKDNNDKTRVLKK